MEENTGTVAKNVPEKINHEPDRAGDYMRSIVTPHKNSLKVFFFNKEQLRQFTATPDKKKTS